jgi:hypothetical protein
VEPGEGGALNDGGGGVRSAGGGGVLERIGAFAGMDTRGPAYVSAEVGSSGPGTAMRGRIEGGGLLESGPVMLTDGSGVFVTASRGMCGSIDGGGAEAESSRGMLGRNDPGGGEEVASSRGRLGRSEAGGGEEAASSRGMRGRIEGAREALVSVGGLLGAAGKGIASLRGMAGGSGARS